MEMVSSMLPLLPHDSRHGHLAESRPVTSGLAARRHAGRGYGGGGGGGGGHVDLDLHRVRGRGGGVSNASASASASAVTAAAAALSVTVRPLRANDPEDLCQVGGRCYCADLGMPCGEYGPLFPPPPPLFALLRSSA